MDAIYPPAKFGVLFCFNSMIGMTAAIVNHRRR
jgi:hypothetical protein